MLAFYYCYVSTVQPYRTSSLVMPGPRTIHEVRGGGPTFQPYRGPQYYADRGYTALPLPTITQHTPEIGVTQQQPVQVSVQSAPVHPRTYNLVFV